MNKRKNYKFSRNVEERVKVDETYENELFKRIKDNDSIAIEELMNLYYKEVEVIAREARRMDKTASMEDLIQQGLLGLYIGIFTYIDGMDSTYSNIRFRGIARHYIQKEILSILSNQKTISLEELKDEYGDEDMILEDESQSEDEMIDMSFQRMMVEEVYKSSKLDDRKKFILIKRYDLDGMGEYTSKELAEVLGISVSAVKQLEKLSLKYIRHEYYKKILKAQKRNSLLNKMIVDREELKRVNSRTLVVRFTCKPKRKNEED